MKKLGENIIFSFLNSFSINILGFLFWFILSLFLSVEEFGKLSYIISLSNFLVNLFSFGIFSALWKYCSENKISKVFLFSILFSFIFSNILIFLFLYTINLSISKDLIFVIFLFSFLTIFSSYFESILYGFQEFKKIFVSNLISSLSKIKLFLAFYYFFGINVFLAIFSTFFGLIIGSILKYIFSFKYFPKKIDINLKEAKRFLGFAFSSFLSGFSSSFFSNFLVIFSFLFVSSVVAGIVYFSQLIYAIVSFLPSIIVGASLPFISYLVSKLKIKKSVFIIRNLIKISIIIILPLTFILGFYLDDIFNFIGMQREFIIYLPNVFLVVSVSATFILLSNILFSILFSYNKIKETYIIEISLILMFVILLFSSNSNNFLALYFFASVIRFFLYIFFFYKNFESIFSFTESIKILIFCFLSFFIPLVLSFITPFSKIFNILISTLLIILLVKILKIFEKNDKKFLKSLKLHYFLERIILLLT